MDIIIISEFCEDFSKSDNDRFLYLAKMLVNDSNENTIEIVTSSFQHTKKKHRREPKEQWPFKITFIEEPGYLKNVCVKRFYSHYIWGKNVHKYIKNRNKKPDVIYCAVPSLTGPNLVAKYCVKEHVRFIIDVQDLWPEAFQMVMNIPILSNVIFTPFTALANGIYKRADAVCGVSETYVNRALRRSRKTAIGTTVFLGTELSTFDRYAEENPGPAKTEGEIRLAYCGTLGSSYDLTCVIDALEILKEQQIRFIVMGDGPRMEEFKTYAKGKDVNTEFMGRIPYDKMCGILKSCDITVNPISHNAAQSIINKHADYAASGLPVVSTQESNEYRKLVNTYQMGFNCENDDAEDLADKIRKLIDDEVLRRKMGENARNCALECFDREKTYQGLIKEISHKWENNE